MTDWTICTSKEKNGEEEEEEKEEEEKEEEKKEEEEEEENNKRNIGEKQSPVLRKSTTHMADKEAEDE